MQYALIVSLFFMYIASRLMHLTVVQCAQKHDGSNRPVTRHVVAVGHLDFPPTIITTDCAVHMMRLVGFTSWSLTTGNRVADRTSWWSGGDVVVGSRCAI